MLTPEEQQKIDEEERYRAEVRARLSDETLERTPTPNSVSTKGLKSLGRTVGVATLLVLAVFFVLDTEGNLSKSKTDSATVARAASGEFRYVPITQKLASGQIVVRAGGHVRYTINITPDMHDPIISGNFSAAGGSSNDISAVIADEIEFTNWINGHEANVYWGTSGRKTVGKFEVRLRPGLYYLGISNQFSVVSDKYVFLDVDLRYQRRERR